MLLALTGYQAGLLVVAALFIAFALTVALVIPRSWPGFPGNHLGVFLGACVLFFAAQLTAVLLLAQLGEADQPAIAATSTTESTNTETTTTTEPTSTETSTTNQTTEPTAAQGDPVAGKAVFTSAGCVSCHTLADAGASGTVGPNLDALKPPYDKVVTQVTNGGGVMPPFKDTLTEQQIQNVAAYVSSVAGS